MIASEKSVKHGGLEYNLGLEECVFADSYKDSAEQPINPETKRTYSVRNSMWVKYFSQRQQ
jgi:hypothetical protein